MAHLARLEVPADTETSLAREMTEILEHVSRVQELVQHAPKEDSAAHRNVFREDTTPHESGMYTDELLQNAPTTRDGSVVVPKIL